VLSEAFKELFSQWQKDFHSEAEGIPPQQAETQDFHDDHSYPTIYRVGAARDLA
jgi:hypothetical protein